MAHCGIPSQVGTSSTDVGTGVSVDPANGEDSYGVAIGGYTGGSLAAPSGERRRHLCCGLVGLPAGALALSTVAEKQVFLAAHKTGRG